MAEKKIRVRGAREHNLKNINVDIPREKLVVITGLSGSGKSSLAFDTIYAEGQRRYVESLSAYARQFLGQLEKPDVDVIEGLSPAISIEQKTTHRNPRSTVATVTEIYDYLRLLYARIGQPYCPECGQKLTAQPVDTIIERILSLPQRLNSESVKLQILAPIARSQKGTFKEVMESYLKKGFVRMLVDGETILLEDIPELNKNQKHNLDLIVDRIVLKKNQSDEIRSRIADSVELALNEGNGFLRILIATPDKNLEESYSSKLACSSCHISFPEMTHRFFSFNSPEGACPECSGLGVKQDFHPDLVVAHPERSLAEGVFAGGLGWSVNGAWYRAYMQALADALGFSMNTPWKQLPEKARNIILYGDPHLKLKVRYEENGEVYTFTRTFEGIIPNFRRRYLETSSDRIRSAMEKYMTQTKCPACEGARLKKEALSVRLADKNIYEFTQFNLEKAHKFLLDLKLSETESKIAEGALREILSRLKFLIDVGVGYLTLDRTAGTLSGGEAQRIRLATQIGSALMGVLYVLDEPSIGLHQSDNDRLIRTLKDLRNLGNTILVVEHDEETMQAADYIIDLGPGAGVHGGEVVFAGTYNQILKSKKSLTGKFLSGKEKIDVPATRRSGNGKSIVVYGAEENNLKKIQVEFPLGKFICVTGLSGSGKSTLVNEILYKALRKELHGSQDLPGKHEKIEGIEHIDKVIDIDQSPIGRTPRSNPATYTGAFTPIRELFAKLPASKMRGYKPGRFSFNVPGGRCEACDGDGVKTIEMHFLADIYVTCEVCKGRRYNHETLEVRYNGKNIHDVLEMTVEEALTFFENIPAIKRKLQALNDVGLSYIKLGQPATTLSGGEAQRVKLATELSKTATGRTLYILDEPTTGLHFYDIRQLLKVLNRLVDAGNTVIVIEHNMDVIKTADYIIDLGPGGGDNGGRVVATGTPEEVCNVKNSQTGKYLKKWLFSD